MKDNSKIISSFYILRQRWTSYICHNCHVLLSIYDACWNKYSVDQGKRIGPYVLSKLKHLVNVPFLNEDFYYTRKLFGSYTDNFLTNSNDFYPLCDSNRAKVIQTLRDIFSTYTSTPKWTKKICNHKYRLRSVIEPVTASINKTTVIITLQNGNQVIGRYYIS